MQISIKKVQPMSFNALQVAFFRGTFNSPTLFTTFTLCGKKQLQ